MRTDANAIALRAIDIILQAAHPFEVEIDGMAQPPVTGLMYFILKPWYASACRKRAIFSNASRVRS